jgi:hypothetical protein
MSLVTSQRGSSKQVSIQFEQRTEAIKSEVCGLNQRTVYRPRRSMLLLGTDRLQTALPVAY